MRPAIPTRAQRRNQTRERLLSAARTIFSKNGYVAASVEDIAAAAGYTRGAFYSNFRSKTELLLELLKRDHDEVETALRRIADAGGTRDEMERALLAYYRQRYRRHEPFLLWMDAKLQAARDSQFRAHFDAFLRERRDPMTAGGRAFAGRAGVSLSLLLPAEVLALGLMGLCDGAQSRRADERASDSGRVADELIDAVLAGFLANAVFNRAPDCDGRAVS
ncbi:TetR/AcrR family transcriptional regulator [Burkholderia sp. MR1-5-21]